MNCSRATFEKIASPRLFRFALIGAAGFGVNEAALWFALRVLGLDNHSGFVLAFFVAVTFTWVGNRILTFPESVARGPRRILLEWLKFVAANALGAAVNYAVYAAVIAFAPGPARSPFVALAFGTIAGLTFNFTLSSTLVFRARRASPE